MNRGTAYIDGIELVTETCCNCYMPFAVTREFRNKRLEDHKTFHCPAGHPQHYTGKTAEQKLREELERKQQMLDAEQSRSARLEQERDVVSRAHNKMRARVFNGVCPCCNRTFQDLMRHMKTEHAGDFNLRTVRVAFGMNQHQVAKEVGLPPAYVSLHERGKAVPGHAKAALDSWVARQAGVKDKA